MTLSAIIDLRFKYLIYVKFYESYRTLLQWLIINTIRSKYSEEELEMS